MKFFKKRKIEIENTKLKKIVNGIAIENRKLKEKVKILERDVMFFKDFIRDDYNDIPPPF